MEANEESSRSQNETKSVLPNRMGGGPAGLGDPSDKTLRKVEREVVIPKLMKERAKELCHEEVKAFNDCGKLNGLLLPFKCRKENSAMQECTIKWYKDPNFVVEVTNQFLEERSEYRRTGIPKKYRQNSKETV